MPQPKVGHVMERILVLLRAEREGLTVTDLRHRLGLTGSTVHSSVTKLVKLGLVRREQRHRFNTWQGPGTGRPPFLYFARKGAPG